MADMSKDFSKKYKDSFLVEARMHVATINGALLVLEKFPKETESFNAFFRAVHTLKGMAGVMNYNNCSTLCHLIEDILDGVRSNTLTLGPFIDLFYESCDFISNDLVAIEEDKEELDAHALIEQLQKVEKNEKSDKPKNPENPELPQKKTNNDPKKDININSSANNPAMDKKKINIRPLEKIQTVGVKVEKLDKLLNLVEDLLVNKLKLESIRDSLDDIDLSTSVEAYGRILSELQYNVMQLRMISIQFIFNQFPRMVRDIAKSQKKEVQLVIEGGDIELDRAVIDEISESVLHIIRNAIDHGLESPEERLKKNKPSMGTIKLSASRTKEYVVIEISDDGAGLNLREIYNKALEKEIIKKTATEEEIIDSIFSEISTSQEVTNVSGRGLGLNIVKNKIENIGGYIQVKQEVDKGTTFILKIPITLTVIKTLFVRIYSRIYAVPIMNIERLVVVGKEDIKNNLGTKAIVLDNECLPVLSLRVLFGGEYLESERQVIIVVQRENVRLGLMVDELLTTEEIVVKPLEKIVRENKFFSGAAIVASGEMVLILDVANFFQFSEAENNQNNVAQPEGEIKYA